ncbi:restriction endonuclease [Halosimplex sp. J119]
MIEVRERNLRTKTGEIDIVLEHTGSETRTLFDSYTRFILVECKNWAGKTPAEEIRKLQNKMAGVDSDLGFFVTTSQLTGYQSDTDASRLANKYCGTPRIVTITPDELDQISAGVSLYEIIDEKLFRQRFDSY